MAKKTSKPALSNITPDRAKRLFRLVKWLAEGPQARLSLTKKLRLNIRTLYRDMTIVEEMGIRIDTFEGKYLLGEDPQKALEKLPFPDPTLTLGEAHQLSRGRSSAHGKLKSQIDFIEK